MNTRVKNLVKHVQNNNALHNMWRDGDTIVVGVSGGPDSMCLLDVMTHIARKERLRVIVAHVNYGLRGADADSDQKTVCDYAKKHDVLCEILQSHDTNNRAEKHLRDMRYDFFSSVQKKHRAACIAVAHTQNDHAETFMLHLLRGSGLRGLRGIGWKNDAGVVRPLRNVTRDTVIDYCASHNVPYGTDYTNAENLYMRNNIRNTLLPHMEKHYNPHIIQTLAQTATCIGDDYDFLTQNCPVFWRKNTEKNTISFAVADFAAHHCAIQRLSLRMMVCDIVGHVENVDHGFIEEMRKIIVSSKNKTHRLQNKNLKMIRKGGTVEFTCPEQK